MAAKPRKKKLNNVSMSSSSSTRFRYKKVSVFVSLVMIFGVVYLLGVSSSIWSGVAFVPKLYAIQVVNEFPHDPSAFTQGLLYAGNGTLYESTGLYGKSSVRRVALNTGKVEVLQEMDDSYFGEGLTLLEQSLFQIREFTHEMEDGWGLATNGKVLFGSDGTSALYQLDPRTLKVIGKQIVRYNGHEVHNLNELEFVNDEVWANVWQTECIARISQRDGSVFGWILLPNLRFCFSFTFLVHSLLVSDICFSNSFQSHSFSFLFCRKGLIEAGYHGIDVLNGIAWDANDNRLFVTGKLWPKLYEIKLQPIKKHFDAGVIEQLCIPPIP
ncbi:glutaminyl-peptide cyclotransferase isoform X1 [Populus alba x Populus x berolinensis]|uniref:Glutaminyl-peptide cyclotransferase isoform X1 n=1 Tax=Populus alba x Populus x berolinensis TaxID=444605 RepID=A0AAD6PTP8_9ROSI|nr:glutaminyl-peptide cyclotransferase isoform X1 [Populus alba x Populus x berolinensis]KAJ6960802.1 glutaminyl-peptide cyclotransferase isoform X1 [Populus alba x Populus x berolinensis]